MNCVATNISDNTTRELLHSSVRNNHDARATVTACYGSISCCTTATTTSITFATATADWGTIVAFAVYDAATTGNELAWADLTANKVVSNGDTASFAASSISITLT